MLLLHVAVVAIVVVNCCAYCALCILACLRAPCVVPLFIIIIINQSLSVTLLFL